MGGGIIHLKSTAVVTGKSGNDCTVFRIHIIGDKAANWGKGEPAICLDFPDNGAKGIHMRSEQDWVSFAAKADNNAVFSSAFWLISHFCQSGKEIIRRFLGITSWAFDSEQALCLLQNIIHHIALHG